MEGSPGSRADPPPPPKDSRASCRWSNIGRADGIALQPPAGHPRYPLLDSCRALAAISVLLFHVGQIGHGNLSGPLRGVGLNLGIGVPVFFAISGFVLYRPFVNARLTGAPRPALREYVRRRVVRILPAYWVALTALATLSGWHEVFGHDFWRYYGLVQIYDPRTFSGGMGVAWTLCIEASFYVVLPVYALALDRLTSRRPASAATVEIAILLTLGAASLALRQLAGGGHGYVGLPSQSLFGTFVWFVPGMSLAVVSIRGAVAPRLARWLLAGRHATVCWLLAAVLFLALPYGGLSPFAGQLVIPVVALLILAPAVAGGAARAAAWQVVPQRLLGHRALLWLGVVSYPVYLYHATLVAWLDAHGAGRLFPPNHWIALAAAGSAAAVSAAALSWYCVERPALRLARRRPPGTLRARVAGGAAKRPVPRHRAHAALPIEGVRSTGTGD